MRPPLGRFKFNFNFNFNFNFKTVGSPPTLAQRVLNETLWNPAFFCCCKIEASQGWNGRVSAATVFVAKCRRLGGSLAAGLQPA